MPVEPTDAESWAEDSIRINHLAVGDLDLAERLVVHVSGPLTNRPLPRPNGGQQRQLSFTLPGWDLRMAAVDPPAGIEDFSFVIDAVPHARPFDTDAAGLLRQRLFMLLSFVAGQQIGVAPVVGLDGDGRVVWAEWGSPRFDGFEQRTWRWCHRNSVSEARASARSAAISGSESRSPPPMYCETM